MDPRAWSFPRTMGRGKRDGLRTVGEDQGGAPVPRIYLQRGQPAFKGNGSRGCASSPSATAAEKLG